MVLGSVHVKYFVIGNVPKNFVEKVLFIAKEFLEYVDSVDYIEIYIYSSAMYKLSFLESEASELGVIAVGDFVAMHEAWRGWPRIHVDYEKCLSLPEDYIKAVLIHELSHAVLHGSPIFYSVAIPFEDLPDINYEKYAKIIYIASTVVKDLDVHSFLVSISMSDSVVKYLEFSAQQISEIDCRKAEDILQLAKLLTPCIFVGRCPPIEKVSNLCKDYLEKILNILRKFRDVRIGDLSMDTMVLVKEFLYFLKNTASIS